MRSTFSRLNALQRGALAFVAVLLALAFCCGACGGVIGLGTLAVLAAR